MLRKWNRFLAFLLAFALVITTFGSDFASAQVYAVEGIEDADPTEEAEPEEVVESEVDEEPAEVVEPEEAAGPEEGGSLSELSFAEETPTTPVEETPGTPVEETLGTPVEESTGAATEAGAADATVKAEPKEEAVADPAADSDKDAKAANGETTIKADPAAGGVDAKKAADGLTPLNEEGKELTDEALEDEDPEKVEDEAEEKLVKVTYSATEGGSVTVTSEEIDINAEDAAFEGSEAQADEGYTFIKWTDADGDDVSTEAKYVPGLLEEDTEFTAVFEAAEAEEEETDAIVVTYVAGEGGTVSVEKETLDPEDEEAKFEGSTATADEGFKFVAWVDENDEPVSEDATFVPSVDLEDDATFKANFEKISYPSVSFEGGASGLSVTVDAPEGAFPEGTTMNVRGEYRSEILDAAAAMAEGEVISVKAVDITFSYDGKEIEPLVPISVKIYDSKISEAEDTQVVHISDDGDASVVGASVDDEAVEFVSDEFSVYVVVNSGNPYYRLKVTFKNGSSDIASMLIKEEDKDNIDTLIYDPGVGTQPENTAFKGWKNANGDILTIDGVRTEVLGMLPPDADLTEVVYTAVFTSGYTVNYLDTNDVSLGKDIIEIAADSVGTEVSYKVNMTYAADEIHDFQGWDVVEGQGNITSGTETNYKNGSEITIKGDVTFKVNAPEGRWLIFDENGKGATYVAPQFVKSAGGVTQEPTIEMKRNGYRFLGWYKDKTKECTEENKFKFGEPLTEGTTIYAMWEANTKAPYTVIMWTQSLGSIGKDSLDPEADYDLKESFIVNEGNVGEYIPYTVVDNGDEDYVTMEGVSGGHYKGFCLTESSKDQQITITPEGDAVLNLYYNRIKYNLKFYYYRVNDSTNQISYAQNSAGGNGEDAHGNPNPWNIVTWYGDGNNAPSQEYGDDLEDDESYNGYTGHYFILSAYYGEDIESRWPTYDQISAAVGGPEPVSFVMMIGTTLKPKPDASGSGTVKGAIKIMDDRILGATNDANGNYVIVRFNSYYSWNYHIWFEAVEGQSYPGGTRTYNGRTYYQAEVIDPVRSSNNNPANQNHPQYNGYDWIKGAIGERNGQFYGNNAWTTQTGGKTIYHINYLYNRLGYPVSFFDGTYVDGNNKTIESHPESLIHTSESIAMNAAIPDDVKNYKPADKAGYIFEGWYPDSACQSAPYNFTTMSNIGGIKVYAKWRRIQYRVFFHPNAENDPSLNWGGSDTLTFRKDYGAKVSLPTGTRTGYEFVGWVRADGSVYSGETVLTETTVTEPRDPNHMTDPMDKWGNITGEGTNSDVGRTWVLGELNLYGRWRKVINGAKGINIVYSHVDSAFDPAIGEGETIDTNIYVDSAVVSAKPAVTAPTGYTFQYWIMQKWDGEKYVDLTGSDAIVYPGQPFTIKIDNAKSEDVEGGKKYTIQFHAKYKKNEVAQKTFIPWFKNDGNVPFHTDSNLNINQEVNIQSAPTRSGYEFLGWTRISMGNSKEEADNFVANSGNYTQDISDVEITYSNGTYNYNGTTATEVAADEKMPYQAMFAVWRAIKGSYTVHYYLDGTTTVVPGLENYDGETVNNLNLNQEITVNSRTVTGYTAAPVYKKITLTESDPDQEVIFYYKKKTNLKYTVHYYIEGTTTTVPGLQDKVVTTAEFGKTYTENPEPATGYTVVDATPQVVSFVDTDADQEITFFYTKKTNLKYTVHYYIEGTTDTVPGLQDKVVTTAEFGKTYTENPEPATGYTVVDPTPQTVSFVDTDADQEITFFYTKKTNLKYTVHYYIEGTTDTVPGLQDKVVTTAEFGKTYTENPKTATGYTVVDATPQVVSFEKTDADQEITFYYTKKTNLKYTVHYYIEGTTTTVPGLQDKVVTTAEFGKTYTENPEPATGYTVVDATPQVVSFEKTDADQEITFFYTKKTNLKYTVHYYIEGTTDTVPGLQDKVVTTAVFGKTYTENPEAATGYTVVDPTPQVVSFVDTDADQEITFFYTKKTGLKYTVHYYIEGTTETVPGLQDKVVTTAEFGKEYTEKPETATGYTVVDPTPQVVSFVDTDADQEITFFYTKKTNLKYTVHYYIEGTTETVPGLQDKVVTNAEYGKTYTENPEVAKGYTVVDPTPQVVSFEKSDEDQVIYFYYRIRSDLSYTVNYLEQGTNAVLAEPDTVGGQIYKNKVDVNPNVDKEKKILETHKRETKAPVELEIDLEGNVVNFYYSRRTDFTYTVHYYKKNTTTPLQADKTESGKTYLATYTEEAPKFIDGYVVDGATTQTFELDKNGKEIFFYYVEREDLSYTVQYLDVDTKKEVADTVVRPNVKLGSTQTEKAIKVTGYVLDASSPEEQSITIVADETKNLITFYYKKRADLGYTVHYYEEGTTIKVAEDKVVTGQIFGADITETAIDVNGYNALEPKISRFTIKEENPDVIFYYARKHYDITLNAIGGSTIYNGDEHSVAGFTVSVDNPSAEGLVGRITDFIEGLVSMVAHAADVSERTGSNQFTIDGLTYTIEGVTSGANGTVAGTYPTVFSGTPVIKQDGRVVTNFGISYKTAELTIGKRNITFISPSASKPYDGTALTAPDIAISDMPLVGGDTATFMVTGTLTDPGTTKNTFTYAINGNADSYNVTKVEGDLTIEGAAPTPEPAPGPTPGPTPAPTPAPAPASTPAPAPAPAPAVPAPVAAVLGATRENETAPAAAVLGARRGRTEDTANIPARVIAVIIAAAVAATLLFTKKKDEDEEEA